MTQSPVIDFGLNALATAYSARAGRCSAWDVVRLQAAALRSVPSDPAARDMVLLFSGVVRTDAIAAGEALTQAVYAWLDSLPVTIRHDIEASAPPATLFAWQNRADLR